MGKKGKPSRRAAAGPGAKSTSKHPSRSQAPRPAIEPDAGQSARSSTQSSAVPSAAANAKPTAGAQPVAPARSAVSPRTMICAVVAALSLAAGCAVVVVDARHDDRNGQVNLTQQQRVPSEQPVLPPQPPLTTTPKPSETATAKPPTTSTSRSTQPASTPQPGPTYPANNAAAVRQILPASGQGALFGMWVKDGGDVRVLERQTGVEFELIMKPTATLAA